MHSKPKLALAILTSPNAAFEEIVKRQLLGTAIVIVIMTGTFAAIPAIIMGLKQSPTSLFTIGKSNPLCWLGLCMLYAYAVHRLLTFIGTNNDYRTVLTVMGWAQVALLLAQFIFAVGSVLDAAGVRNPNIGNFVLATNAALPMLYAILVGVGLQAAYGLPVLRGVITYLTVALPAAIGLEMTYGNSRIQAFQNALPGIKGAAEIVAKSDMIPLLGAGVIGLTLGVWFLAPSVNWDSATRKRLTATAGIIGVLVFGAYAGWVYQTDYYGSLLNAQRLYNMDKFDKAAKQMETLLPIVKNDPDQLLLDLDIGDTYFLAGNDEQALTYYNKPIPLLGKEKNADADKWLAQIYSRIGAVYDISGRPALAISQFQTATKKWPEFREPWVRIAVTYDRIGEYGKAIDSANTAVQKLGSEAPVAWVALAEAFTKTNDARQAGVAITMVRQKNEDLAKRIGPKPEEWNDAVAKLTRSDLKFSLEKDIAKLPAKPKRKK